MKTSISDGGAKIEAGSAWKARWSQWVSTAEIANWLLSEMIPGHSARYGIPGTDINNEHNGAYENLSTLVADHRSRY